MIINIKRFMNILMSVKFIFKRYKYESKTIKDDINEKKEKKTKT